MEDIIVLLGTNIFITTGGGIGDMIMFTPALRKLKELYPNCKITILTLKKTKIIMDRLPYIDKVLGVERGIPFSRWRCLPDLIGQDVAIFTDWQPHVLPFAKLLGIPYRAGYGRPGKFMTRFLTQNLVNKVSRSTRYAADTNALVFSEALHIDITGEMTYPDISLPTREEYKKANELLKNEGIQEGSPFVVLAPNASKNERNWTINNIERFIKQMQNVYNIPVVIVGMGDLYSNGGRLFHNLLNKTSIMEMVALIEKSKGVICTDSGPMHIAAALSKPVFPVFNKDLPSRWAPRHKCKVIDYNLIGASVDKDGFTPMDVFNGKLIADIAYRNLNN